MEVAERSDMTCSYTNRQSLDVGIAMNMTTSRNPSFIRVEPRSRAALGIRLASNW